MPTESVDVLIVCALPEESRAVWEWFGRLGRCRFSQAFSDRGRELRVGEIRNVQGQPLNIQVSWLPDMGGTSTMEHIAPLLDETRPRFAGMTGICAGNPERVELGDIIVATRAYEYDVGKISLGPRRRPRQEHDVKTVAPNTKIIQWVRGFSSWEEDMAQLVRPLSRRQQRDWILSVLQQNRCCISDVSRDDLLKNAPRWRELVRDLKSGPTPWLDSSGAILDPSRLDDLDPFPYRDRGRPQVIEGVVGSGRAVRADAPFPTLAEPERKLLGIDMEIATFYHAVESIPELGQHCLAVKGVTDFADAMKDDCYREYASAASAVYMYHFVVEYVTEDLIPRPTPKHKLRISASTLPSPPISAATDDSLDTTFAPIKRR